MFCYNVCQRLDGQKPHGVFFFFFAFTFCYNVCQRLDGQKPHGVFFIFLLHSFSA